MSFRICIYFTDFNLTNVFYIGHLNNLFWVFLLKFIEFNSFTTRFSQKETFLIEHIQHTETRDTYKRVLTKGGGEGTVGTLFWYKVRLRKDWESFVYPMGGSSLSELLYLLHEFGFVGTRHFINLCKKKKKKNLINSHPYITIKY